MDFTTGVKHHKCFRVELFFQIWLPYNEGMKYVGLLGPNWASPNGSAGECPRKQQDCSWTNRSLTSAFLVNLKSTPKVNYLRQGHLVPGQYRQLVSAQSPHPTDCQ